MARCGACVLLTWGYEGPLGARHQPNARSPSRRNAKEHGKAKNNGTIGRRTYNARSETVAKLPSFRESWSKGWRCVIPVQSFYEPNWETGKAVRWLIQQPGEVPMGLAGIYRKWHHPDGREQLWFTVYGITSDITE